MRPAKQDPSRHPTLVGPSVDPPRILTEAPVRGTASKDDVGSLERSIPFGGSGIELQYPARLVWPPPWVGHIPFAFWLVEALRPRVVVELGVHSGNSYCAFLQAVQSLELTSQCYGIDHWRGDEHSDHYDDDVYAELCSYHDPLYGTFSSLIRATFEEALLYVADGSVDLLHIDGFHTYEAVAKDFSDWLPKVSSRGVVLFHDINVRERAFGVWRFWEEIAARYQTFAFVHSHGLGVAYVGSDPPPDSLRTLLATADPETIGRIRSYFARLGTSLVDRFARRRAEDVAGRLRSGQAELEAARAEIRRQVEMSDAVRFEAGKATAQVAVLQNELAATRAEIVRQIETDARLRQELAASRAETARQAEAVRTFQQQCAEARSELGAIRRLLSFHLSDAGGACTTCDVALLEDKLEAARAEIARQLEGADASRAATQEVTGQVAILEQELSRARDHNAEVMAQRDRATQLLRQQITATAALQRELAGLRQNQVVASAGEQSGASST
jgi:hypothetical protein